MSTRCNIHFTEGDRVVANIYRHCDGYPDGVLPDLEAFFTAVEADTKDTRFRDPSYLAAKFVVWQAGKNATTWDGKPKARLDFISVGIVPLDADDGEYVYTVDCSMFGNDGRPTVTLRED